MIIVASIQTLPLFDIFILISKFFFTRADTAPYAKMIGQILGVATIVVAVIVFKRYRTKYWTLWEHWKNETSGERLLRGWLVFLATLLPFVVLILIGVLT